MEMSINEFIAYIAAAIMVGGMVPYILDIIKGKTQPNLVSWITWTLLTCIGTFAALSEGAVTTAILSGASTVSTLLVVILGIRNGIKRYTLLDIVCQVLAILGIILWQTTQDASVAIAIVVFTDMIACLPTIRHAWRSPHAETWPTFATGAVGAGITIFTITHMSFAALAYPLWLVGANLLIPVIILYRRRVVRTPLRAKNSLVK